MTHASVGWLRTYQGGPLDVLTPFSVVQTSDGGYATAVFAYLRQEGAGGLTSSYELQILKTDASGVVQWKHSYPTVEDPNHLTPTINTYSDQYVIVQTADQGYVVAGSNGQFWLFKVNAQGSVVWSRTYQLNDDSYDNSHLESMTQTIDSGFALAGSVDAYEGGRDFWLVKTNSLGIAQWNQTYNSGTYTNQIGEIYQCDDEATSVVQTIDGGYALVGSNSLYRKSTSSLVYASWVVKTDAQGKQVWNQGYDLINEQGYRHFIIQTSDNGYAIAGTQNGDFCLFKITSTGQLQWNKAYGDPQTDTPCSLVQLEDGGFAIAGTWTPTNTTAMRATIGLLRTDSTGQTLWIKSYSAKETATAFSYDQANAMVRINDGGYALVGTTTFGSETHQDILFVKTETLEQIPHTTPLPIPKTSEDFPTENPEQTAQLSSNPTESSETQNPIVSNTPYNGFSESILQIGSQLNILVIVGIILVVVIISMLFILRIRRNKPLDPSALN